MCKQIIIDVIASHQKDWKYIYAYQSHLCLPQRYEEYDGGYQAQQWNGATNVSDVQSSPGCKEEMVRWLGIHLYTIVQWMVYASSQVKN